MAAVAAAAGVARGTVYRYFPTRSALLAELAEAAIGAAGDRLAAARLETLDTRSALERAVRALIEGGDAFIVVAREGAGIGSTAYEERLVRPLCMVFERGQGTGEVRSDVSPSFLTHSLLGVLVSVLRASVPLGRDDLVLSTTNVFMDGARGKLRAASASS